MNNIHNNYVLKKAYELKKNKSDLALATVISTWGSSPRPTGSQLLVDQTGKFFGSVSGGCIEGEVIENALKTINDNQARFLEFGVSNAKAWNNGLACGGKISIYIEKIE